MTFNHINEILDYKDKLKLNKIVLKENEYKYIILIGVICLISIKIYRTDKT